MYTHEIPKESEALFKKLLVLVPDGLGVLSKHVYAADWLAEHPRVVMRSLEEKKQLPDLYAKYKVWSEERCSYTIRFFDSKYAKLHR